MKEKAEIGIFGGSGFYQFLENGRQIEIKTPYGQPSDKITIAELNGRQVAFLPRHGAKHQYPAHRVPYQANVWAMKELGVKQIIGPCAAGSLQENIKPGSFVICDQFVDRTTGRHDTFFDQPPLAHIQSVDAYCPQLSKLAVDSCAKLSIDCHPQGTVVVIQGPRFSSSAESAWFTRMGWQVVNMTQYPEVILAHELGICYVNISLITDYDAGLVDNTGREPVTTQAVIKFFNENNDKLKKLISKMIENWPAEKTCQCQLAAEKGKLN